MNINTLLGLEKDNNTIISTREIGLSLEHSLKKNKRLENFHRDRGFPLSLQAIGLTREYNNGSSLLLHAFECQFIEGKTILSFPEGIYRDWDYRKSRHDQQKSYNTSISTSLINKRVDAMIYSNRLVGVIIDPSQAIIESAYPINAETGNIRALVDQRSTPMSMLHQNLRLSDGKVVKYKTLMVTNPSDGVEVTNKGFISTDTIEKKLQKQPPTSYKVRDTANVDIKQLTNSTEIMDRLLKKITKSRVASDRSIPENNEITCVPSGSSEQFIAAVFIKCTNPVLDQDSFLQNGVVNSPSNLFLKQNTSTINEAIAYGKQISKPVVVIVDIYKHDSKGSFMIPLEEMQLSFTASNNSSDDIANIHEEEGVVPDIPNIHDQYNINNKISKINGRLSKIFLWGHGEESSCCF